MLGIEPRSLRPQRKVLTIILHRLSLESNYLFGCFTHSNCQDRSDNNDNKKVLFNSSSGLHLSWEGGVRSRRSSQERNGQQNMWSSQWTTEFVKYIFYDATNDNNRRKQENLLSSLTMITLQAKEVLKNKWSKTGPSTSEEKFSLLFFSFHVRLRTKRSFFIKLLQQMRSSRNVIVFQHPA